MILLNSVSAPWLYVCMCRFLVLWWHSFSQRIFLQACRRQWIVRISVEYRKSLYPVLSNIACRPTKISLPKPKIRYRYLLAEVHDFYSVIELNGSIYLWVIYVTAASHIFGVCLRFVHLADASKSGDILSMSFLYLFSSSFSTHSRLAISLSWS